MKLEFNFRYFFYGCWLFFLITPIFFLQGITEESLKINLTEELKKGNFLIGIKQYLGANSSGFSGKKNITFETKNNYLELNSSNGFQYKSKKINIVFDEVPLKNPIKITNGHVNVQTSPGLGIEVNNEIVNKFKIN